MSKPNWINLWVVFTNLDISQVVKYHKNIFFKNYRFKCKIKFNTYKKQLVELIEIETQVISSTLKLTNTYWLSPELKFFLNQTQINISHLLFDSVSLLECMLIFKSCQIHAFKWRTVQ